MSGRELLEDLVKKGAEELRLRDKALDKVMARARRARILSKQAILKLHSGEESEAGKRLEEASGLIVEMNGIIEENPELGRFDQVSAAKEEYSEASIIRSLMESGEFPDPAELGVPITSYLLGLGDVPGELRRQALDALRVGDMETAEARLSTMEEIYLSLMTMDEAPLLKGLRRKMDIARGVIERTRSEVTAEAGRRKLGESVERLAGKLEDR
jgi:translin